MNKTDLIKILADRMSISRAECLNFVNTFQDVMMNELREKGSLVFHGFGSFRIWEQSERMGRNPRTGVSCMIRRRKSIKFKPGKDFLYVLNDKNKNNE